MILKNKHTGWLRVLGLIIPYIIIFGIFQGLGAYVAGIDFRNPNYTPTSLQTFITQLFGMVATFMILWGFMEFVDKENFTQLGFQTKNRLKDFIYGFSTGLFMMLFGFGTLYFMKEITLTNSTFNTSELLLSIGVFAIVAIVEEMLFRGYILRNFMYSFPKYIALTLSALLFSLVHGANPNMDLFSFFELFLAGIFLGISYIYTKNLWLPIGLHFSWNLIQSLVGFNVSGQDFYSIINFKIQENNLLNGGKFGFEGSILSVFVEIIFITIVWKIYQEKLKV